MILLFFLFCLTFSPINYWIVGDSEAGATSAALKEALPSGSKIDLTFEVSSRIEKWAAGKMANARPAGRIDVVIVFLGTNNYYDQTLPSPEGILKVIRSTGAKCIWVGPPKVNNRSWKLNNELRQAVEPTCKFVDSQQIPIALRDGIHPTPNGARTWARKIAEELR